MTSAAASVTGRATRLCLAGVLATSALVSCSSSHSSSSRNGGQSGSPPTSIADVEAAIGTLGGVLSREHGGFGAIPPGLYTYTVTGASNPSPAAASKPVATTETLTAEEPTGGLQTLSFLTAGSSTTEVEVYRFSPKVLYLDQLTFTGTLTADFRAKAPGVISMPLPPLGTWSWDLTADNDPTTTLHGEFRSLGAASVPIGGKPIDTWLVAGTLTIKTTNRGTPVIYRFQQSSWFAQTSPLQVRAHQVTDETQGNVNGGHADVDATVQSFQPSGA